MTKEELLKYIDDYIHAGKVYGLSTPKDFADFIEIFGGTSEFKESPLDINFTINFIDV